MTDKVLGTVFQFRVEGLPAINKSIDAFTQMTGAVGGFTQKAVSGLANAGGSITAFGMTMLAPLNALKNAFTETGTYIENIQVQLKAMAHGSKQGAKELFDFVSAAAYEIPYSMSEALDVTQQFSMMGVEVNKTYGKVARFGEQVPITFANAMSGLAAKSGASLQQIGHNLRAAIQAGRADYLEYWIGAPMTMMMKMSGVFVGTWQDQFDKAITFIGGKYAQFSSDLAASFGGIMQGFSDMSLMMKAELMGAFEDTQGAFYGTRKVLGLLLDDLAVFFYRSKEGALAGKEGLGYARKLGEVLSDVLLPLQMGLLGAGGKLEGGPIAKILVYFKEMIKWMVHPANRSYMVAISRFIIAIGALASAFGLWLTFMKVLVPLLTWFVALSAPMLVSFTALVMVVAMAANILTDKWGVAVSKFGMGLEWLARKLAWASNFFKVMFQIMLGANDTGGAWVSEKAWGALGPKAQGFLLKFLEVWSRVKVQVKSIIDTLSSWWEKHAEKIKNIFEMLGNMFLFAMRHWKLLAGIWVGKTILGGLFGGGSSSKSPLGTAEDPIYTKESSGGGLIGFVWGIAKFFILLKFFQAILPLFQALSLGGLGTQMALVNLGFWKFAKWLGLLPTSFQALFTILGKIGTFFVSWEVWWRTAILSIGTFLGSALLVALSGAIGFAFGKFIDSLLMKLDWYREGWSAVTDKGAEMFGGYNTEGVKTGVTAKEVGIGTSLLSAAALGPVGMLLPSQFTANIAINGIKDITEAGEKLTAWLENWWDIKMRKIASGQRAAGNDTIDVEQ